MGVRSRRSSDRRGRDEAGPRTATSPTVSPKIGSGPSWRTDALPASIPSGTTFADAAAEFLRYTGQDRGCKPSTLRDCRSNLEAHLLPTFGDQALESITAESIEAWRSSLSALSPRTKNKLLVVLHGVFRRAQHVWGLPSNPVATVEKYRQRSSGDIDVFSPEKLLALVRAATSEQDAPIYLVAAFTGLRRGELLALRWRDVDFGGSVIRVRSSYAAGQLTTPKSGKVRAGLRPLRFHEYADVRVMPTWVEKSSQFGLIAA